jgi:hypothetical protein
LSRWFGAVRAQRRRFEIEHLGLVEFVHAGALRPGKPPRPRVRPAARITTWRIPASTAATKKSSMNAVRAAKKS